MCVGPFTEPNLISHYENECISFRKASNSAKIVASNGKKNANDEMIALAFGNWVCSLPFLGGQYSTCNWIPIYSFYHQRNTCSEHERNHHKNGLSAIALIFNFFSFSFFTCSIWNNELQLEHATRWWYQMLKIASRWNEFPEYYVTNVGSQYTSLVMVGMFASLCHRILGVSHNSIGFDRIDFGRSSECAQQNTQIPKPFR